MSLTHSPALQDVLQLQALPDYDEDDDNGYDENQEDDDDEENIRMKGMIMRKYNVI